MLTQRPAPDRHPALNYEISLVLSVNILFEILFYRIYLSLIQFFTWDLTWYVT